MPYPLFFLVLFILQSAIYIDGFHSNQDQWPVPYQRVTNRSKSDPYCQAYLPFCPTGDPQGGMPTFDANDTIEIFSMQTPVWEARLGELLKFFNIMHDAIGFRSVNTGVNYTIEWYELFQLFNSTFPHVVDNYTDLLWCNQGATCIYKGIDDNHWLEYGSLIKIGEMSGFQFQNYSDWVAWDNSTGIFYETWRILDKPDGQVWFESFDCADFVLRTYTQMASIGVKFNHTVKVNYTDLILYSDEPVRLGTLEQIKLNKTLFEDMVEFFVPLQPQNAIDKVLKEILFMLLDARLLKKFYFYFNNEYWYLQLHEPYIKITYDTVLLP